VQPVAVRILHPVAPSDAGPLATWLGDVRARNAGRLVALFARGGVTDIELVAGEPDGVSFGARLREIVAGLTPGAGLVVLGSGAMPLAANADVDEFIEVARSGQPRALANNAFSADALAIGRPDALAALPDLSADNALPRWLREVAGLAVADLHGRWHLSVDLDSPLDAFLVDPASMGPPGVDLTALGAASVGVRRVARDRRAELVVAGRTNAITLSWLERFTVSRTRALVEERGLRASSPEAVRIEDPVRARPPRSILGLALDDRGPEEFGSILGELGDGAIVDSRVLLAHRLGADDSGWPTPEDRFASDLLLPDRIGDPWLQALTASAVAGPIPILLGGHSLVGPGIRLLLRRRR
jgi:hypothetical protein